MMPVPAWRRAGLPTCTINMLNVMKHIYEKGNPFAYVNDVDPRTLRALIRRDWVIKSIGKKTLRSRTILDDTRYKLTGRGAKALQIYAIPPEEYDERRWDGICCRCGERERGWYSNGKRMPYCKQCDSRIKCRARKLFGYKNPGLCPDCGERDKHIMPSGRVRSYCLPCRRKRAVAYRKQQNEELVRRAKAGEVFLCYGCHERPRQLTKNTLQDYCRECLMEQKRQRRMVDYGTGS